MTLRCYVPPSPHCTKLGAYPYCPNALREETLMSVTSNLLWIRCILPLEIVTIQLYNKVKFRLINGFGDVMFWITAAEQPLIECVQRCTLWSVTCIDTNSDDETYQSRKELAPSGRFQVTFAQKTNIAVVAAVAVLCCAWS